MSSSKFGRRLRRKSQLEHQRNYKTAPDESLYTSAGLAKAAEKAAESAHYKAPWPRQRYLPRTRWVLGALVLAVLLLPFIVVGIAYAFRR